MKSNDLPAGLRGVAYLRISTDQQDVKSQRESIDRWLAQRGLSVARWYEDVGSRDLAHKRPDFQRLLLAVKADEIDWIVVDAKDRFGTKNAYEFGKFASLLQDHDCQLWSVLQGNLTANDATTEILAAVDSVRSRDEQVARSQRSLRGKIAGIERGEWQGGYAPFGFDVACLGTDGHEKWRVYYIGTYQRLKFFPDGRPPDAFNGKDNFPAKDRTDVLRLVPSRDTARVEMARKIFHWFATESISLRGVATRLNQLGVHPVNGEGWYSARLGPMLRNPVYIAGSTVYNKKAHGRFLEFKDGQYQEVPRKKGRTLTGRNRKATDFIYPKQPAVGLVDQDIWDRVQAKLRGVHRPAWAPRNPALWLAGLLVCGRCGGRMCGWHTHAEPANPLSYTCPTYRKFGRANKQGCRLHRVPQRLAEALVERYLDEAGQTLDAVLASASDYRALAGLRQTADGKVREYARLLLEIERFVQTAGPVPELTVEVDGVSYDTCHPATLYRPLFEQQTADATEQLAAKEAELERLVRNLGQLTSDMAVAAADRQLKALEAEILTLRARLRPLDERVAEVRAELRFARDAVRAAREAIGGDSHRKKSQALGRLVARIVCHFRHQTLASGVQRSFLERVVFEPPTDDPKENRASAVEQGAGSSGCGAANVPRSYGPEEIGLLNMRQDGRVTTGLLLPEIVRLRGEGLTYAEIGQRLGVTKRVVGHAMKRHRRNTA